MQTLEGVFADLENARVLPGDEQTAAYANAVLEGLIYLIQVSRRDKGEEEYERTVRLQYSLENPGEDPAA